jgi:cell division protein FtsB
LVFREKTRWAAEGLRSLTAYGGLSIVVVVLLAAGFAFRLVSGSNGWAAYRYKKAEYLKLQQEVQQLQKGNEELEEHVKALKYDPAAIEKEAREQLGYARPGETVYVLQQKRPEPTAQTPATAEKK